MSFVTDVLKLYVYMELLNDIHYTVLLHAKLEMGSVQNQLLTKYDVLPIKQFHPLFIHFCLYSGLF